MSPTIHPLRELALVREYDLFIPLYYNDVRPIEPRKFQDLQQQLLDQFGGLTFFPRERSSARDTGGAALGKGGDLRTG